MTATYIHTKRKAGTLRMILNGFSVLYLALIVATIVYLWGYTHDRYITSSAFKISRQDGSSLDSGLAQLALPGFSDAGAMDSQIAIGYVNSADMLVSLEKEFDLIAHYSAPRQDVVFRLNPKWTLEERLDFYRKRIVAHFDKDTGLTMLAVDTFDPQLSLKIATTVLKRAEAFVNQVNQQIADQQLEFIRGELERANGRVMEANRNLIELQNQNRLINPDEVISSTVNAVQELQMNRLHAETDLASLLRDSPSSPLIETLRSRLRSVNELIDVETAKLSGPERDRMNQVLWQFKELQLKLDFAIRMRSSAEGLLEKNRVGAASRSRFFSVIQNPFLPEDVGQPRRWYATVSILVIGLLLFLAFRALTHSVFESS